MRLKRPGDPGPQLTSGWRKLAPILALGIVLGSLTARAAGTGTLDQVSGWYPLGANLTVQAIPGTNSVFTCWQGNTNGATLAGPQITFAVSRSLSVTGLFSTLQWTNHALAKISVSGKTLVLNVTTGAPNGGWVLLQSTNLSLPLSQWQTNRTGLYDGNGNLLTNLFNTATNAAGFFILK